MKIQNTLSLIVLIGGLLIAKKSFATKFDLATVDDPILRGETCQVRTIVSYGSYIYDWDSKYDGIYWPYTTEQWMWFCPTSGYISFGNDFSDLSEAEKETIREFLQTHYIPTEEELSVEEKLSLLESIYQLREKDEAFWAWFYRVLAYWYNDTPERSLEYRQKAIPLLENQLTLVESGIEHIQILYLLGEYHRQLGQIEEAKTYFQQAKTHEWIDEEGTSQVGHPYINGIIEDREQLMNKSP